MDRKAWRLVCLSAVILVALWLRIHDVSKIFLWLDETDFFNENLYGATPKPLLDFAWSTRNATTNTWGWPMVVWLSCRVFGATLTAARAPSVFAGTLCVLFIFLIVYRLSPEKTAALRFPPAILASGFAAITIPQIELSQRTYPYAAAPMMAAALILAHLKLHRVLIEQTAAKWEALRSFALYTLVGIIAVCVHPSLGVMLIVSLASLAVGSAGALLKQTREVRLRLLGLACGSLALLSAASLLNAKNPKYGFRRYLVPYYHPLALRSIPKLLLHLYDLGTYHLNLFYNTSLYWPERANWAVMPLVALCAFGWILCWQARFGESARRLAWFCTIATILTAALSVIGVFPFGGVRQTFFLSPFLFAFAGIGLYALFANRATRIPGALIAVAYLAAWGQNLPRFYNERVAAFAPDELLGEWTGNGKLPYYTSGSDREIQYLLLAHPEVKIEHISRDAKPPYLIVSTHWPPLENNHMFYGYAEFLKQEGYRPTLIFSKPPKHLESLEYSTCLYFPPNGLWIYKVTAQ